MSTVVLAARLAAAHQQGGHVWAMLNWALGIERCGHRVHLVEPAGGRTDPPPGAVHRVQTTLRRHGFGGTYTVTGPEARWTLGRLDRDELLAAVAESDLLVNLSGVWRDELAREIPRRLYVDLDPGFTQVWHAQGVDVGLDGHTAHATVGLEVARGRAAVPDTGRTWLATLPPVVLDAWPSGPVAASAAYTTVANWRSYGTVHHHGVRLGQKAHTFREFLDVPRASAVPVEAALSIHPSETTDLAALDAAGWRRVDAAQVAGTAERYQAYLRHSRGELGLAKEGYVVARTGWVSDRTACFLASGRPALVQDTGGGDDLPDQDGFVRFSSAAEAVELLDEVDRAWSRHALAARELARRRFAHDVVLPPLLGAA